MRSSASENKTLSRTNFSSKSPTGSDSSGFLGSLRGILKSNSLSSGRGKYGYFFPPFFMSALSWTGAYLQDDAAELLLRHCHRPVRFLLFAAGKPIQLPSV